MTGDGDSPAPVPGSGGLSPRPVRPGDAAALQAIRAAAFAPVFASFRSLLGAELAGLVLARAEDEQAEALDALMAEGSSWQVLVAERHGTVAGFCALRADPLTGIGEIGLNAVAPEHQGRGIGRAMYAAALEALKAAGMRAATVGTGGDASHAPARAAYARAGFQAAIPSLHLYREI